jgi:hypothetical protein
VLLSDGDGDAANEAQLFFLPVSHVLASMAGGEESSGGLGARQRCTQPTLTLTLALPLHLWPHMPARERAKTGREFRLEPRSLHFSTPEISQPGSRKLHSTLIDLKLQFFPLYSPFKLEPLCGCFESPSKSYFTQIQRVKFRYPKLRIPSVG